MLIRDATLVAIDFETTGPVPGYRDVPWQVGLVPIRGGKPDAAGAVECLLHVPADRPFNPVAPGSWRRIRDRLAAAPTLADRLPELRDLLLGHPLVAHNAATERKVLREAWPLQRPGPWVDTLVLARQAYPSLGAYDLGSVITHVRQEADVAALAPGRGPHDALYDAAACAVFFCHLMSQPAWSSLRVEDLVAPAKPRRGPR